MSARASRRNGPLPARSVRCIALASVNFATAVAGPGGGARVGWVVEINADAIAYYPGLALVSLRKGQSETAHPVSLATRMVPAEPLGDDS